MRASVVDELKRYVVLAPNDTDNHSQTVRHEGR